MPTCLGRTPFTGGTVGQRMHLACQLIADDSEFAGALETERRHLGVWIVAQFVRLVDLNTIKAKKVKVNIILL